MLTNSTHIDEIGSLLANKCLDVLAGGGGGGPKKEIYAMKNPKKKIHAPEIKILAQAIDWEKTLLQAKFPPSPIPIIFLMVFPLGLAQLCFDNLRWL